MLEEIVSKVQSLKAKPKKELLHEIVMSIISYAFVVTVVGPPTVGMIHLYKKQNQNTTVETTYTKDCKILAYTSERIDGDGTYDISFSLMLPNEKPMRVSHVLGAGMWNPYSASIARRAKEGRACVRVSEETVIYTPPIPIEMENTYTYVPPLFGIGKGKTIVKYELVPPGTADYAKRIELKKSCSQNQPSG